VQWPTPRRLLAYLPGVLTLWLPIYKAINAASNADWVVSRAPWLGPLARDVWAWAKSDAGSTIIALAGVAWLVAVAVWPTQERRTGGVASLSIRFSQDPPHIWPRNQITHYRLGVYNAGPDAAENVQVWLAAIQPRPKDLLFPADFPYRVWRSRLDETRGQGIPINPHSEELFEIARSWVTGPPDNRLIVDGINTKIARADNLEGVFSMERDEAWEMAYRISAANAPLIRQTVLIRARGDTLSVYLKDAAALRA
jgi:hypothetical protein